MPLYKYFCDVDNITLAIILSSTISGSLRPIASSHTLHQKTTDFYIKNIFTSTRHPCSFFVLNSYIPRWMVRVYVFSHTWDAYLISWKPSQPTSEILSSWIIRTTFKKFRNTSKGSQFKIGVFNVSNARVLYMQSSWLLWLVVSSIVLDISRLRKYYINLRGIFY